MAEEEQVELDLEQDQDTEVEVKEPEQKEDTPEVDTEDNFQKAEDATQKGLIVLLRKCVKQSVSVKRRLVMHSKFRQSRHN